MRANSDMPIVIRQGGIVTADSERRNHIVRELVLSGKLKGLQRQKWVHTLNLCSANLTRPFRLRPTKTR